MAAIDSLVRGPIVGANTARVGIVTGDHYSILTSNSETVNVKTSSGFIHQLVVSSVGTTWQIDFYDATAGTSHDVFTYVSAMGTGVFPIQCPMGTGIRIVESGTTAGVATLIWS